MLFLTNGSWNTNILNINFVKLTAGLIENAIIEKRLN